MPLYVLAFTDSVVESGPPGGRALHHANVRGIYAIYQRRRAVPPISDKVLREQHRAVLEIASRARAVLPVRFGALVERDELAALVRKHEATIRAALDDVRDRSQMTLRIPGTAPLPAALPAASGRAYLEQRRQAAFPALPADARTLLDTLGPLVVRERHEPGAAGLLATFYHLIATADVARYRAAAQGIKSSNIISTGPWPPFAFTPQLW